jgi:glycosyltransferase involved in cell wall biosynthesis
MKDTVVIFIDRIAAKNRLQIKSIHHLKMVPVFFVNEKTDQAAEYLAGRGREELLAGSFLKRFLQISGYLKKNKHDIHHIEVYPAGRFAWIYILLSNILNIKSICVERGDIQYYRRKMYNKISRFSMWACYKFSSIVWYREFYMKDILQKTTSKKLFFLHNAIDPPVEYTPSSKKDIDFLWMNRVIKERRSDWFISVLKKSELKNTVNYLIGLTEKTFHVNEQLFVQDNKPDNLIVLGYTKKPFEYYMRAKFFVLPADIVFANNSLLEAMSYGVVPLISDMPGASMIVEDGKSGFIFKHTPDDFGIAVEKAHNLTDEQYSRFSKAARDNILKEFSLQKYAEGLTEMYELVGGGEIPGSLSR